MTGTARALHILHRNIARLRRTTIDDARRRFPTIAAIHAAYGKVLPAIWAADQVPADESAP